MVLYILNHDEFIERVHHTNPDVIILSEYHGTKSRILTKCKICGTEKFRRADGLLDGRKCLKCVGNERGKKLSEKVSTNEKFVGEVKAVNPNIEPLENYTTRRTKIKFRCLLDGNIWSTTPKTILDGHGCPMCANKKQNRRTNEEFIKEFSEKHKDIIALSKFNKTSQKMSFKCSICNYTWDAVPNALLNRKETGCPKCNGKVAVEKEEFLRRLHEKNIYVEYVSGYTFISKKCVFACKKCSYQWDSLPTNILGGKSCPKCNMSHGAKNIINYLEKNNIQYCREKRFDGCRGVRPLPFDFYLPQHNICIEYDGEQHFEPVKFGNCDNDKLDKKFNMRVAYDKIKTDYCNDNKIKLIRIPYTDFNDIDKILDKHLS